MLLNAITEGVSLLTWEQDTFAFADGFDEAAGRYQGLRGGQRVSLHDADSPGLVVKPPVARKQLAAEGVPVPGGGVEGGADEGEGAGAGAGEAGGDPNQPQPQPGPVQPRRFHGSVTLDAARVGRDAGKIAEEVIAHLAGLVGAEVTVTLEIQASIPAGAPDNIVRTVTENARTLKFSEQGFEKE